MVKNLIEFLSSCFQKKLDKNSKETHRVEAYSSYSEFIRRTALIEAARILKENNEGEDTHEHN